MTVLTSRSLAELDELRLDHVPFVNLLPSEKQRLLERACDSMLSWKTELVTFATNVHHDRTHAVVKLIDHHNGEDEYVVYLVAFNPRYESPHRRVYFDDGRYGLFSTHEALKELNRRGGWSR